MGKAIGWTAIVWIGVITVLFFAPAFYPWLGWSNINNFNWAGPLFALTSLVIGLWWVLSAKKWFTGPKVQGTREELLEIEAQLQAQGDH